MLIQNTRVATASPFADRVYITVMDLLRENTPYPFSIFSEDNVTVRIVRVVYKVAKVYETSAVVFIFAIF